MSEGRRVKRWAPKVFSGCSTCKRRRIKCDEGKPTCQRCARSGLQCEGYAPPTARMFEPGKKSDLAQSQERTLVIRESTSSVPSTSPFQTPEEVRSFQFYMSKTADLISIYSQRHFWTTIIPQASHEHTSVKHSVLALSILHESLARTDGLTEDDNSRLFHHYNTAIRALTQSQPTTDIVLITCILFWTVENFNGAGQPSFDHMEAAQKILREFKAKANHTESPHYTVINRYIEPIVIDGVQHARTRSVDIPEKPSEPERVPSELIDRIMPATLPTTFPNLGAASDHLRSCIQALLHIFNNDLSEDDTEILIERIEVHLQRWIYLFHSLTAAGTACNRRLLVIHHVNTTTLLAEFKKSLDLELHQEEDFKSQYTWNVTEIEELLASKLEPPSQISHDLGVIPPLFTAAVRCTDPDVRARATTVLISLSRVEGCWSDSIAARIAHTIDQARLEGNIGVKLSKMSVSTSGYALSIRGTDPVFDRFVGGPEVEMEQFDMVSYSLHPFNVDIVAQTSPRLRSTVLSTVMATSLAVRFGDLLDLDRRRAGGRMPNFEPHTAYDLAPMGCIRVVSTGGDHYEDPSATVDESKRYGNAPMTTTIKSAMARICAPELGKVKLARHGSLIIVQQNFSHAATQNQPRTLQYGNMVKSTNFHPKEPYRYLSRRGAE